METIRIIRKDSEKTGNILKKRGYISRTKVIDKEYREKYNIPDYKTLRELADKECLNVIKIITYPNEKYKKEDKYETYWFEKQEIEELWIKPKQKNKQEEVLIKLDEKDLFNIKDKIIQDIEEKADEFFKLTKEIKSQKRNNIEIYCPFTIGAVQKIWNDCIAEIQKVSNLNITVKYANKIDKLDSISGINDSRIYESKK